MFTGLIRDVGTIRSWQRRADSARLSIETKLHIKDLEIGASVSCNGACLTVIEVAHSQVDELSLFTVEAGPQTLSLTRFGESNFRGTGERINLEPALRMGDSLGGHMVSGHIDALGTVLSHLPTGDGFWCLRVGFDSRFAHYVLKKGSVAVAGVSLTIAECSLDTQSPWLEIMLIPHTLEQTNLLALKQGSRVEIEFDSQAKIVADMLRIMLPSHLNSLAKKN
jgi:riboflavin synthase